MFVYWLNMNDICIIWGDVNKLWDDNKWKNWIKKYTLYIKNNNDDYLNLKSIKNEK